MSYGSQENSDHPAMLNMASPKDTTSPAPMTLATTESIFIFGTQIAPITAIAITSMCRGRPFCIMAFLQMGYLALIILMEISIAR